MAPEVVLHGRDQERASVLELLASARTGRGSALVVAGGPGSGKTALLRLAHESAIGLRVLTAHGVPTETGLPHAGLHRLLQPLADRMPTSLATVTGLATGTPSRTFGLHAELHRFLVEVARERPLLIIVDDAGLLDAESLEALAFVARRVSERPVSVLFGREPALGVDPLEGVRTAVLRPLDDPAAMRVLAAHSPLGVSEDHAEEVLDLAGGNPLALVELARSMTPGMLPPDSTLRSRLHARLVALSPDARRLVQLAVADDDLELDAVVRAGLELDALEEARAAGLLVVQGEHVRLPTVLTRTTLRTETSIAERREAHALLAEVLDPDAHRSRWLWHRAAMTREPSEGCGAELGEAAAVARRAGDYAASSQAFQRAAALTREPAAKAAHLIAAAADHWSSGRPRRSREVLRQARTLTRTRELHGLADFVRGGIELGDAVPGTAVRTLRKASDGLLDSRRTIAVTALMYAAEASSIGGDQAEYAAIAEHAQQLRRPDDPPVQQLIFDQLEGMAATFAGKHHRALPALRRAVRLADGLHDPRSKIWGSQAAYVLGNADRSLELATQAVASSRDSGMVSLAPWALVYRSVAALLLDQHSIALDSSLEGVREATAMGQPNTVVDHLTILALMAALQGNKATAVHRLHLAAADVARRGLGRPSTFGSWAFACVDLVDDRPVDALNRLRLLAVGTGRVHPGVKVMTAPHFVEAAVACGQHASAAKVLRQFEGWAVSTGAPARLALSHRSHALLLGAAPEADEHFREAIRLHREGGTAMELAKTELFYGHRLRRSRQPRAAREHLRDALKIFQQYDSEHFVNRVRAELRASGDTIVTTHPAPATDLTPQQSQIARLVAEGATNREIAAQLFISHRTVEHHLRNIFAKLEVRSRVELARLLG
ncbi:LuxR C-terminal-related transcriptional regulator [Umezawaea sp. Da 62-37]|uniref:helix-turn-helix transcriptional regulator n=1 Tax=Umezawaea sp. Da 62-37 TaxID=3075927 RepID=UPI0028F6D847|nr:LuxR C-terminal-related transcriptional regulator [Umezawaea sp. Da 62-37]WNV84666.1 LuxR C-terminal-related transcriptional regulator [Umezawaea sp. Da 62-37]